MRRLIALLFSVALASATIAEAAPMPWKLFNEKAMLNAVIDTQMGMCPVSDAKAMPEEVFIAGFKAENGDIYIMVFAPSNNRIAFAYTPAGAPGPTEIGTGVVNPKDNNTIPALHWQPFVEALHNHVCGVLFPKGA